jgi:hypothetical protein
MKRQIYTRDISPEEVYLNTEHIYGFNDLFTSNNRRISLSRRTGIEA